MSADDATLEVVRGWIRKAENDLENAKIVLRTAPGGPMDTVAFHAQQSAEKYLKALLCFRGDAVPRIHDIEELLARTGMADRVDISVEETRILTDYAILTRTRGTTSPCREQRRAGR